MSNLVDVVAERRLVAIATLGRSPRSDEARAVLELFPPSTLELRELLKGRKPSLANGRAEERCVKNEWPVDEPIGPLAHRLWLAQARRDLMKVAMSGLEADVRRCWAVLQRYEVPPKEDAELLDMDGHRSYLGDGPGLARVKDPSSGWED